jgi:hypothetical protein
MPPFPSDVFVRIQIFAFAALFVMALVWLGSVWWLFRRLHVPFGHIRIDRLSHPLLEQFATQ